MIEYKIDKERSSPSFTIPGCNQMWGKHQKSPLIYLNPLPCYQHVHLWNSDSFKVLKSLKRIFSLPLIWEGFSVICIFTQCELSCCWILCPWIQKPLSYPIFWCHFLMQHGWECFLLLSSWWFLTISHPHIFSNRCRSWSWCQGSIP